MKLNKWLFWVLLVMFVFTAGFTIFTGIKTKGQIFKDTFAPKQ